MRLPLIPIEPALPPFALLPWFEGHAVCALDAGTESGWRSAIAAGSSNPAAHRALRSGSGEQATALSSLVSEPSEVFSGGREALSAALRWLASDPERSARSATLTGYLSYELGHSFEPLRASPEAETSERDQDPPDSPCVWLAGSLASYFYCKVRRQGWVEGSDPERVRRLARHVARAADLALRSRAPGPHIVSSWSRTNRAAPDEYLRAVGRVLDWIRAGDVYQVNLSRKLMAPPLSSHEARALYQMLQASHPAPFSAFIDDGAQRVLSNSPERFLRVQQGRVETRPIKGTRPRGRGADEDALQIKALRESAKDLAEHLMIVDLERNDLGRVCRTGSVHVPRFGSLETFSTVHHLESSVQGELRDPTAIEALLAATFPGGSITGAPKIRAREIIQALEREPRGVYTGAIGLFDAAGELDLSIAIRTAVATASELELRVGGGIVADSIPENEFTETCDKARAFARLLGGDLPNLRDHP